MKWLREQCLFSATLWREHAVQAEEREKAALFQAAADVAVRRRRADDRPIAGTNLIRDYQGALHQVTVLQDGYE